MRSNGRAARLSLNAGQTVLDLAVIGAGVSGCGLAARLRQLGWGGSLTLVEIGRGPGGRAATRRSRSDRHLAINHGAPLFNITGHQEPKLLEPLRQGGWIHPFGGAIQSLDAQGRLGTAQIDALNSGQLWQGSPQMDSLSRGLLSEAQRLRPVELLSDTLVRALEPLAQGRGWALLGSKGERLLECRWLVLSGTLLAHPRCRRVFGWDDVPLQQAAERVGDPSLLAASAALAAIPSSASTNLLLSLPATHAQAWRLQPWRLLQFTAAAQQRWGIRRVSLQAMDHGRWAAVVESSASFAMQHLNVYGSRSSAAQRLGAAPEPSAEAAVINSLDHALQNALGLSTAGAERQLMRWGAAFPEAPGLPPQLSLCPTSRIGFCGDAIAGPGFARVEGALRSAEALAERILPQLLEAS